MMDWRVEGAFSFAICRVWHLSLGVAFIMSRSKKPVILIAVAFGALICLPVIIWLFAQLGGGGSPASRVGEERPASGGAGGAALDYDLDQLVKKARGLVDGPLADALRRGDVSLDFMAELKKELSRGEDELRSGRLDRARSRIGGVVTAAESRLEAIALAEKARALRSSTFGALQRLEYLRPTYPNNYEEAVTTYNRALAALEGGDFGGSIDDFELTSAILGDLEARSIQRIAVLLETAAAALEAYQLERAREAYASVLAIEPSNLDATRGLTMVSALEGIADRIQAIREMEARGELEAALAALEALAADRPGNPFVENQIAAIKKRLVDRDFDALVKRSEAAEASGDLAAAIEDLESALQLKADAVQRARLAGLQERYKAVRLEQLLDAAFAALERGQYAEARDRYREAQALDANSEEARLGLEKASSLFLADIRYSQTLKGAERRIEEGRFPLAAKLFNDAMASRPPAIPAERQAQEARIREVLQKQSQEVRVEVTSDRRTYVSIIGVLPPDRFSKTDLRLFPDVYKVRGTRSGYREVEVEFRVDATKSNQTIHVACTEKL